MKTCYAITTPIITFVFVLALVACDNKNPSAIDAHTPVTLLEEAYQQQSTALLQQFFAEWNALTVSKTDAQLRSESELIQDVYAIFRAFYDPFNLSTVSGSSWHESLYTGTPYIIVQASVSVQTEGSAVMSVVEDFRPPLDFPNAQVVYLTEEYRQILR